MLIVRYGDRMYDCPNYSLIDTYVCMWVLLYVCRSRDGAGGRRVPYTMVWFGTGMYAAHCTALCCTLLYCTVLEYRTVQRSE